MNTSASNPITTVLINETELKPVEYRNQRVITLSMMDKVHGRPDGTARKRFKDNGNRLVEGEDYFEVTQPSEIRTAGLVRPQGGYPSKIILLTETGYLHPGRIPRIFPQGLTRH
ncbi:ORF6N domain-containing protein [Desulforegula conservatrix]|uniref:ORF6N domain-containing protein n=1 Tax=Desulforegula conservatrix TaxID=153026 RepID=UPI000412626D|nr:ORF6N domain-containing protein [Desulforegula conservatrix]